MEVRLSASAVIEWGYQRSLFEALGRVEHKARFVICYQKQPSSILCSSPSSRLMNLSSMIKVSWPPQAANQDATQKTTAITQDGYFRATGRRGSIALSVLSDSAQRFTSITPTSLETARVVDRVRIVAKIESKQLSQDTQALRKFRKYGQRYHNFFLSLRLRASAPALQQIVAFPKRR